MPVSDLMNYACFNCNEGWYEESTISSDPPNTMCCVVCGHKIGRYPMDEKTIRIEGAVSPEELLIISKQIASEPGEIFSVTTKNPCAEIDLGDQDGAWFHDWRRLYLAGPFFNKAQIDLLVQVENLCEKYKVPYFSPRKHAGVDYDGSYESAEKIFRADLNGLHACGAVLACMDWKMEGETIIAECNRAYKHELVGDEYEEVFSDCVDKNIPDPGTVWECGYTAGYNAALKRLHKDIMPSIPVFVYTTKPTEIMNLMIHIPAAGVFTSMEKIEEFIQFWASCLYPAKAVERFKDCRWVGGTQ